VLKFICFEQGGKKSMRFLKNAIILFLIVFSLFGPGVFKAWAQDNQAIVHLFWSYGCPHCQKEKDFLAQMAKKYSQLEIRDYEVSANRANSILLESVGVSLGVDIPGVPFMVVGREYIVGYLNDETTGKEIEMLVNRAIEGGCQDIVGSLLLADNQKSQAQEVKRVNKTLTVPAFGKLDLETLSLPVLTFVVAFLDGFNPCAMWVLIFLISLLLGMKDRKRMWLLGVTFIGASSLVYFLFLSAWLNLFLFLGFISWVRIIIGLVAISAGGYYLWDYWTNKSGSCRVMAGSKRQRVFEKLKTITGKEQLWLAVLGMVLLAFAVNLVELICSAGLPAVYTQVLSLANLPAWQYYLYLVVYVLVFMLDDLVVFFVAMITLKVAGLGTKYSRVSHLVGGILIFIIGLLLIFKPEVLMFG
jgi:thiol-disulfide isomerase/thioredoxin